MLVFETAADRLLHQKKINMLICGPQGVGKTFSARTLDPEKTLFIDCEAGTLSLERSRDFPAWQGTTMNMLRMAQQLNLHPWILCRAVASILFGPDPLDPDGAYSPLNYQQYVARLANGDPNYFARFDTLFVDSLTVVSRWAFDWACSQPENITKSGALDTRGAYGTMGRELVTWATVLQHQPKNIILSVILEQEEDEYGRNTWQLQVEGKKAGKKIPGIFDLVMTLNWVDFGPQFGKQRVFITREGNEQGVPAKDRSGLLEAYEAPDLGAVIRKIQNFHSQQGA